LGFASTQQVRVEPVGWFSVARELIGVAKFFVKEPKAKTLLKEKCILYPRSLWKLPSDVTFPGWKKAFHSFL